MSAMDLPLGTVVAFRGGAYTIVGRRRLYDGSTLILAPVSGEDFTVDVSPEFVSEVGSADAENTAVEQGWVPALPAPPVV
jgi:hypothetical protein